MDGFAFYHMPRTGGMYLVEVCTVTGITIVRDHKAGVLAQSNMYKITMLRNPVDRVVSLLKFVRGRIERPDLRGPRCKRCKHKVMFPEIRGWQRFEDIAKPDSYELCNNMVKRLSGHDTIQPDSLAVAQRNLHGFAGVGLTEQYTVLLDRIYKITGVKPQHPLRGGRSRSNESKPTAQFTDDQIAWIRHHNQLDQQLYDYAVANIPAINKMPFQSNKIAAGIKGLAKAALGIDRAEDDVIAERRNTCRACEWAERCKDNVKLFCRCKKCGCLLKAKTSLRTEKCPIGRW